MENNSRIRPYTSNGKVIDLANCLGLGVSTAFFASLQCFSCMHLNTTDDTDDEEDDEEAHDRPLMLTVLPSLSVSSSARATKFV
ncbi:hypothetical protein DCAR_0104001 [Daucus carota subsp. sativus]|uniref:Uncharacterized protein n=1 Tax=Daucus carota subsp. sativus TaxID=79200 RepID=A0A162B7V7_DAUCS|nr:hypothetical protein DCAR_0104001 [Daucus carota subsp. sativus]